MAKNIFLIFVVVAILIWIGSTFIALRKHKMAAIAIFFTVTSALVFILLMVYIGLLATGYNPIKEDDDKRLKRITIMNSEL